MKLSDCCLPDGLYRHVFCGPVKVEAQAVLRIARRLDVSIYVGPKSHVPAIRLYLGLESDVAIVLDLYGNGPASPWHRRGLGALAVNTAIGFLKEIYEPGDRIWGHIPNIECSLSTDHEHKIERQIRFCENFGLTITGDETLDNYTLHGRIGDLKILQSGAVLGLYPRSFNIDRMTFEVSEAQRLCVPAM